MAGDNCASEWGWPAARLQVLVPRRRWSTAACETILPRRPPAVARVVWSVVTGLGRLTCFGLRDLVQAKAIQGGARPAGAAIFAEFDTRLLERAGALRQEQTPAERVGGLGPVQGQIAAPPGLSRDLGEHLGWLGLPVVVVRRCQGLDALQQQLRGLASVLGATMVTGVRVLQRWCLARTDELGHEADEVSAAVVAFQQGNETAERDELRDETLLALKIFAPQIGGVTVAVIVGEHHFKL